jgi:hypothetical protein
VHINNNGQILVVAPNGSQNHSYLLTPANVAISFDMTGFPASVTAGAPGSFTVTARNGTDINTGYTGTVWFSSSDSQAVLPGPYTFTTADAGVHTFNATLKTAGTRSITVVDTAAGMIGSETGILVNPATASRLLITGPSSVTAGSLFRITITAFDPYGNIATGYTGTLHFSSSDSRATLPANYTFTAADAGVHTSSGLILRKKGTQTITITDTLNPLVTGSLNVNVS